MICIAGKSDMAVDVAEHVMRHYPNERLVVIPNRNDPGKNTFQKSLQLFARMNGLACIDLEQAGSHRDLLFLSLEFDRIIKPSKFASKRLFNIHFSRLPAYKGMFTSAWPILNGEKTSGVTLHEIDAGIDTGRIIAQHEFPLAPTETVRTLWFRYVAEGTRLMIENLPALLADRYRATVQPAEGASYYSRASINYGALALDLNKTAVEIDRQVRAFAFREYQLPKVMGHPISRARITETQSNLRPGNLVRETERYLELATIDYNIELHKDHYDRFWAACAGNRLDEVKLLAGLVPDLEVKSREGWTALIMAAYHNALDVVDFLLQQGADVNATNYNATSVVMYAKAGAVRDKSPDTLKRVLAAAPDLRHRDIFGKTVLDYVIDEDAELHALISRHL
ncbi:MAG TPA: formyltransferase family protein [Lacunisphaera sp.]|nr:formyltransferase family protein [Lacunisphaera sp.]